MGLENFTNIDDILKSKGENRGLRWKRDQQKLFKLNEFPIIATGKTTLELHLYTPSGETLLSSLLATNYQVNNDEIFIDYAAELKKLNILRGHFKTVINVHKTMIGNARVPLLTVKEISADRRELQLVVRPDIEGISKERRGAIIQLYLGAFATAYEADLALNFGSNRLFKILSHKAWIDGDDLIVRLYEPLPDDIKLNDVGWIVEELTDPIIDDITLSYAPDEPQPNVLRGANFEIDVEYNTITETNFGTWNSLLDSNLSTSQKIIDSYFSGSLQGINLGIDYTGFDNFVHYSSAFERVSNFKYKLELVEYYDQQIGILNDASGSNLTTFVNNISKYRKRKNNVIGSFDAFENWLYNEPTSSLTTHGVSGSFIGAQGYTISPYPKFMSGSNFKLHHTTSSIAQTWFDGLSATASLYDEQNDSSLIKTIPEHIRLDKNNSEYELFINMIGHHFDIVWSYIDGLARVYKLEEQPKLSIDKSILPNIAKSLGWSLTNGKQASQLWQYRLGTDTFGAYAQTGSIFTQSDQEITHEVWRRIVNNLPYLLKTKGTSRSIKALMNIYGIPQTLLSIREYGGPKVGEDVPALIEDKFSYAINFNSGSNINYSSNHVSSSIGSWGIEKGVIPPITREFRFRPYTGSNMMLYTQASSTNVPQAILAVEHTESYSGSAQYGRLILSYGKAVSNTIPMTASTDWVPIFNGQYWNVRYYYTTTGDHYNSGSNTDTTYNVEVQNASDFIFGKINYSSSLSITPTHGDHYEAWSEPSVDTTQNIVYIGGTTASSDTHNVNTYLTHFLGSQADVYTGSMQEYREWLELLDKPTFDRHTFNPTSYVSSLSPSSSYDTLVRQYTLGSNTVGFDLSTNDTIISSSHPNQLITDFVGSINNSTNANTIGFVSPLNEARGNFIPVEETYYIEGVSSGMNSAKSQKIRFDDNTLIRQLSPTNTSERSRFDFAQLDSNKLGLFYSFADQVNKDIFNQVGDTRLDDFIGDPELEFENEYFPLNQFSRGYWKKYTNKSDVNSYVRIFSQFDFALFNQIKQTLAERIDDVSGILIEPHVLERSKNKLTKRPSIETPNYEMILVDQSPTSSAVIAPQFEALIEQPVTIASSSFIQTRVGDIDTKVTQSLVLQDDLVITASRSSQIFSEVIYKFRGGSEGSLQRRNFEHAVSKSLGLFASKSLAPASYMDDFFVQEQNIKFNGSQLVGPGVNINSNEPAINFSPVVEVFETNPNQLIYTSQPQPPDDSNILVPGNLIVR